MKTTIPFKETEIEVLINALKYVLSGPPGMSYRKEDYGDLNEDRYVIDEDTKDIIDGKSPFEDTFLASLLLDKIQKIQRENNCKKQKVQ